MIAEGCVKNSFSCTLLFYKNPVEVIPMKRLIEVGEIVNAVAFLASDEASGITGQTLFVDGGWSKDALPEDLDMQ